MNNDLRPINTIPNFKRFCMTIGELPTSYLETMTYYEMLVWFTEYMKNTIIPTINNNGLAVQELQDKYIELKSYVDNYFTNLDVQEEINNKLDEMVADGTIQNLLLNYLNLINVRYYDTFIEALNDNKIIPVNAYIITRGYETINDGGASKYLITHTSSNTTLIFGENYAQIQSYNGKINVLGLGITGTTDTDYTALLQNLFDYCNTLNCDVEFNNTSYYFQFINATAGIIGNNAILYMGYFNSTAASVLNYLKEGAIYKDLTIDAFRLGSYANVRTDLRNKNNITIENITFKNFIDNVNRNAWGLHLRDCENIRVLNCKGENNTLSDIAIVDNCNDILIDGGNFTSGIDIEPNQPNHPISVNINSVKTKYLAVLPNSRTNIYMYVNVSNSIIDELHAIGNYTNFTSCIIKSYRTSHSINGEGINGIGNNLIPNPTFLDYEISANPNHGWKVGYASNRNLCSIVTNNRLLGNCLCTNTDPDTQGVCNISLENDIAVEEGDTLLLEYDYYGTDVGHSSSSSGGSNNIGNQISILFYDSNNQSSSPTTQNFAMSMPINGSRGLTHEKIIIKIPENIVKMNFQIGKVFSHSSEVCYVTNVSLKHLPSYTGFPLFTGIN